MAVATSELIWIKSFLASLGIFHEQPMKLFSDNQAALHIAKNPVLHERTEHIELDCHFVREELVGGFFTLMHMTSQLQPADIFTKALGKRQFQYLKSKLGMVNLYAPIWGEVLGMWIVLGMGYLQFIFYIILYALYCNFFPKQIRIRVLCFVLFENV